MDTSVTKKEENLREAERIVDLLEAYRRSYFIDCVVEKGAQKETDVRALAERALKDLQRLQPVLSQTARYHYLYGRCLNSLSAEHNPEAELSLQRAVKLDPAFVLAWTELGDVYLRRGCTENAELCFSSALKRSRDKFTLRGMSTLLRQLAGNETTKLVHMDQSVALAKEALVLDPADGSSWYNLANALLTRCLLAGQPEAEMEQCLKAYRRAEMGHDLLFNADFRINKATALKYSGFLLSAMEDIQMATLLDPSWEVAKAQAAELGCFLKLLANSLAELSCRPTLDRAAIGDSLRRLDVSLVLSEDLLCNFPSLRMNSMVAAAEDLCPGPNPHRFVVGIMAAQMLCESAVYRCFVLVDRNGRLIPVVMYNTAKDLRMKSKDMLIISSPILVRDVGTTSKEELTLIKVTRPSDVIVNGCRLKAVRPQTSQSVTNFRNE